MKTGISKHKLKICRRFISIVSAFYGFIFILTACVIISSDPTLKEIFTDQTAISENNSGNIKTDIIIDVFSLKTSGGITILTKNLIEKISERRPE